MLTKEQIQFTGRYLEKSGVKYMDIRHEMTDHIATALENREGEFYDNFREYMVQYKHDLMQSNRYFKKLALRRAFGILKNNVTKPAFWLIALVTFISGYIAQQFDATGIEIQYNLQIVGMIIPIAINLYFLYYWLFKRDVHSVLMKLLLFIYFGSFILRLPRAVHNTNFLIAYHALYIAFYILLAQSIWQLQKQYKLRYND